MKFLCYKLKRSESQEMAITLTVTQTRTLIIKSIKIERRTRFIWENAGHNSCYVLLLHRLVSNNVDK